MSLIANRRNSGDNGRAVEGVNQCGRPIVGANVMMSRIGLIALIVGVFFVFAPDSGLAQTAKKTLEQQLAEQQATNEALRQRIAKIEAVLEKGVCDNPEAAALLKESSVPVGTQPAPQQ